MAAEAAAMKTYRWHNSSGYFGPRFPGPKFGDARRKQAAAVELNPDHRGAGTGIVGLLAFAGRIRRRIR